jgi:hypothetical protein
MMFDILAIPSPQEYVVTLDELRLTVLETVKG